jgi:hypothetical protein
MPVVLLSPVVNAGEGDCDIGGLGTALSSRLLSSLVLAHLNLHCATLVQD